MIHEPQTRFVTSLVDAGTATLAVTQYAGNGRPLVLLHGIGSSHTTWWPVIDPLARHFRLIAPDWRGHGASDKPDLGYLVEDYAADLDGLLRGLGLDRPLVLGHSLGGTVALHWASNHPGSARRLVVEDPPLRRHEDVGGLFDSWIALASQPVEQTAAYYAREYPHWSPEECLRRAETIASVHLGVFTELRDRNLHDDGMDRITPLAAIDVPTLLVHGDVETGGMVPEKDAQQFAQTIPNATVRRIPGGSHSLHRDHVSQFLDAVLPFLIED
jgi:N-formylmaleamate deformylase